MNQFSRLEYLIGKDKMNEIKNYRIAVFGIGGVGGYVVESLVRSGIHHLAIIDNDKVSLTNLNRQIIATHDTIDKDKVDVMEQRIHAINPNCIVETYKLFILKNEHQEFDFSKYDYLIDCVDTVTAKLCIIENANKYHIPVISCMGTGNKLDPSKLEITDVFKTSICPLARVMRYELKKRGIKKLTVLYSLEDPIKTKDVEEDSKKVVPGSSAFVPSVAGIMIASYVFRDLLKL